MNSLGKVVVASTFLLGVVADLPVHCLKHQVEGDWDFTLSALSSKRSSCGHLRPDTEQGQPARTVMALAGGGKPTTVQRVALHSPNVAKSKDDSHGTWTMVYDEGFEVTVGGLNFLAFSNFTFEENLKDLAQGITHKKESVSHC